MQERLTPIDSLRGIASLGVAIPFHFRYMTGDRSLTATDAMPLGLFPPAMWLYRHGDLLVELFFVISGFVFHHVYRPRGGRLSVSARDYATARFARLYPLLALSTIVTGLLLLAGRAWYGAVPLGFGGGVGDWIRNLLCLQLLKVEPANMNAPTWSISTELVCYVLFFLFARLDSRLFHGLSTAAAALGLLGLSYLQSGPIVVPWFLARGLLGFFVGVLLYTLLPKTRALPTLLLTAMLLVASAAAWIGPWPLTRFSSNAVLAGLVWPLVVLLAFRAPFAALFQAWPLRKLGDLSYSVYLVHMPIIVLFVMLNNNRPFEDSALWWVLPLFATVVIAFAQASFRWFEMPARRLLRRRPPRVAMAEFVA